MKTDDADVNGIHILFLREGALQVVTALKSDEVHVIWLRVDERIDSRVAVVARRLRPTAILLAFDPGF